jgi:putative transposase
MKKNSISNKRTSDHKRINEEFLIDKEKTLNSEDYVCSSNLTDDVIKTDELNEEQIEQFAENWRLVCLIKQGVSISKAKTRLGISRSERSIRNLVKKYKLYGQSGLIDRRYYRTNPIQVLISETKAIILGFYFTYPAAGPRLIWKKTCVECKNRKLEEPSESSVKKYIVSLPEPFKMFRNGKVGIRRWEQTAAPVIRYENTTYANERWQGDHSPLPIWIRVKVNNKWVPARVHISALLDAHSRAVAGYIVSAKYPDSWTISLLFYKSISVKSNLGWRVCGMPFIFQSDRGKDFLSKAITACLAKLKIIPDVDPPGYPNNKGKVERLFLTLNTSCLLALPGHMSAIGTSEGAALKRVHELLTLQQLDKEIEKWIVEDYHQTIHSETNRKPIELWEETAHLRLPANNDDLNLFLLKEDKERTVKNIGIQLKYDKKKHVFWSPELVYYFRYRVRLAYNPEDLESVIVYCADSGERICEAFDMYSENSRYTLDDIKSVKRQFRRGLLERIVRYREEIKKEDRRDVRKKEWEEARKKIEEETYVQTNNLAKFDDDEEVKLLLEKFKRRDRVG